MLLTKIEVKKRIETIGEWLNSKPQDHYLYRSLKNECDAYLEAELRMNWLGLEEMQIKVQTEFYNQIK